MATPSKISSVGPSNSAPIDLQARAASKLSRTAAAAPRHTAGLRSGRAGSDQYTEGDADDQGGFETFTQGEQEAG